MRWRVVRSDSSPATPCIDVVLTHAPGGSVKAGLGTDAYPDVSRETSALLDNPDTQERLTGWVEPLREGESCVIADPHSLVARKRTGIRGRGL